MPPRERVANLLDAGSPFLEIGATAAHGMYRGAAPAAGLIAGHRPRPRAGGHGRRQRRHREGRHLLPDDGEKASPRAGDRRAEPSALRLSRRFRRRQPAQPGRGLPRPRPFRPHLLQPGEHERQGHPPDRRRHGLVHGGRRLCPRHVRRLDHREGSGHDLPRRPAAGEGRDGRGRQRRGPRRRRCPYAAVGRRRLSGRG